jgi:hypothetical protein
MNTELKYAVLSRLESGGAGKWLDRRDVEISKKSFQVLETTNRGTPVVFVHPVFSWRICI